MNVAPSQNWSNTVSHATAVTPCTRVEQAAPGPGGQRLREADCSVADGEDEVGSAVQNQVVVLRAEDYEKLRAFVLGVAAAATGLADILDRSVVEQSHRLPRSLG